ncbi:MAG: methionyl-tRNA formyltransferase [Chloroflexota bacterium]
MRVVFMGTPDFAVPSLARLIADGYEIALVITQPDRPAGRGRHLAAPPVKELALAHGLPVLQPRRLRDEEALRGLVEAAPDVIVVAAFGQILPTSVLELPWAGCLNVHASLLPRYRGASPISAAILAGDAVTGVTIMRMDVGLDTGAILAKVEEPILPPDTTGSLSQRLAQRGAALLSETLRQWLGGAISPEPQDDSQASYAHQLRKEDGVLVWQLPARSLWRQCRALSPWPGTFTRWQGKVLKVLESAPLGDGATGPDPGTVSLLPADEARHRAEVPGLLPSRGRLLVAKAGQGELALLRVQLAGGKPVRGDELAAGHGNLVGGRLG